MTTVSFNRGDPSESQAIVNSIIEARLAGVPVDEIVNGSALSRAYVYQIFADEKLRDRARMRRFYAHRRNLGKPLDPGGPRDEWIERDVIDEF